MIIINTRADIDALAATDAAAHAAFLALLEGSRMRRSDIASYPPGYGAPGYPGPVIEPVWQDVEDPSVLARFGIGGTE